MKNCPKCPMCDSVFWKNVTHTEYRDGIAMGEFIDAHQYECGTQAIPPCGDDPEPKRRVYSESADCLRRQLASANRALEYAEGLLQDNEKMIAEQAKELEATKRELEEVTKDRDELKVRIDKQA